ncbi:sensor histidine kinase [Oceanirhabdus sp. W0125-5]|uniref:sensor histidine kinase n=1 Tax=Oceanirhabdus sp. W0125-5 TaxID=2999116 RepID=UPI0022F2B143|nr:ATP-binding protein [Oceanirhabdus sp. W0125-5]WBW96914.1 ATP-binding protein [Oceanirhabdus sp. W0125-5]
MKKNNNPLEQENFDKIMRKLHKHILSISDSITNFISSPPKRFKIHLKEFKAKITRLFRFSITFKLTFFSSFKILREILGTILFFSLLFFGFNIFIIRNDFITKSEYISSNINALYAQDSTPYMSEHIKSYMKSEGLSAIIKEDTKILLNTFDDNVGIDENTQISKDIASIDPEFISNSDLFYIDEISLGLSKLYNSDFYLIYKNDINVDDHSISLTFVRSLVNEQLYIQYFLLVISISFLLFLLSCSKYISKLTKRMIQPVYTMNDAIKEINVSSLDTRLNVSGSQDELKDLAITVNNMFDRIQDSYEKQKQFVSDASHELRTPIAVIQGYANLLSRWGKDDKDVLEESILAIKDESDNMKDLVEKLLFLARADKHTQKIEKTEFNLSNLIENICKETKLIDSNHTISSNTEENLVIFADPKLIKQAIRILVDNSIKYTPETGYINISAFSEKDEIIIRVSDTGMGIPSKDIPHIFDRFYRVDESRSKQDEKGGTGLGLSIAKWIVNTHKGKISAESTFGEGSTFTIKLPFTSNTL